MSSHRALLFLHDEDPALAAFFLEEALEEWKTSGLLSPFFVDCYDYKAAGLGMGLRDSKEAGIRQVKALGSSSVPACRAESLPHAVEDSHRRKLGEYFSDKTFFVAADPDRAKLVMGETEEILYLVKAKPESISALYKSLSGFNRSGGRVPRVYLAVSGSGSIERATEFFVEVKDEVTRLMPDKVDLRFVGWFAVDPDKVSVARAARTAYRDLYKGDGLYGKLRYMGKRIAKEFAESEAAFALDGFAAKVASFID